MDDWELLQAYAKLRSESAFTELVQRHLNWVHSAALRQVGDPHLAQDVAQTVFILLARKAGNLRRGTILAGWLFRTTHFVAASALRSERRRRAREEAASAMMPTTTMPDENEILWNQLAPHLDQAVAALSSADHCAILLRFYEKKSLREVGQQLGLTEEAAKKRVTRAVDKMRKFLARRGVALGGAGLVTLLAVQTVQAAPQAFALSVLQSATAGTSAWATLPQLARETLRAWRWAQLKLATVITLAIVGAATLVLNRPVLHKSNSPRPTLPTEVTTPAPSTKTAGTTAAGSPDQPSSTTRVLVIHVREAKTNRALPNADISVKEEKVKNQGHTDDQGQYAIALPPETLSNLSVTVHLDGYVPMRVHWTVRSDSAQFPADFTFALEPAVPIGGMIQDEQGQPIANTTVAVADLPRGSSDEVVHGVLQHIEFLMATQVVTDVGGHWQINTVPANPSRIGFRLSHPDFVFDPPFDSTRTPPPEQLHDMTGVMVMKKGVVISGTVLDESARAIPGVKVTEGDDRTGPNLPTRTTTDASGNFQFPHSADGLTTLAFQAAGYSPELKTIDANSTTKQLEVRLTHGHVIRGRIVGVDGKPIEGARIRADRWRDKRTLDWEATTDSEGRFVWTDAPPDEVRFNILKTGYLQPSFELLPTLKPDADEQVITLARMPHVRGTVVDDDTSQPVATFRVTPGTWDAELNRVVWDEWRAITFGEGQYDLSVMFEESGARFLRVEATGYDITNLPFAIVEEGATEVNFRLHKRNWPSGIVRAPDGQPAVNAHVFAIVGHASLLLRDGKPSATGEISRDYTHSHTEADGSFHLSLPGESFLLVAVNDQGLAQVPSATANFPIDITLQPWGRVEGMLSFGTSAATGQPVRLIMESVHQAQDGPHVYATYDDVRTDEAGRFVFERVLPGEVVVEPSRTPLQVKPGETTYVKLGGQGRPVIGRILLPTADITNSDTSNVAGFLDSGHSGEAAVAEQATREGLNQGAIQERVRQWYESDAGKAYHKAYRLYRLHVAPDGSFRADQVPPGAYSLHIEYNETHVVTNDTPRRRVIDNVTRPLGLLDREMVVPEIPGGFTDEPLDLGDLQLVPVPLP